MDLIKDATKNINLYDVKAYVRKAQNVAMNLTPMEAKVREATNNEPWGALTRLMSQIAVGTYSYHERQEIMTFIFRRFTEKATNEWRQIYKALQLLDYLIRNGNERVIDNIRSNISLIQMLKSFHYIDSKGRDQGINVRNRAKNIVNLLNDDSQLRSERKKARNSRNFVGVSSAQFGGASSITNGDEFMEGGDFTNRVFGDGGVYGARYGDSADEFNKNRENNSEEPENNFEEYNVEEPSSSSSNNKKKSNATTSSSTVNAEPDLLGDLLNTGASGSGSGSAPAPANADDDDDDFDDFQSAPTQSQPQSNLSNLSNLYQSQSSSFQPNFQHQQVFNNNSNTNNNYQQSYQPQQTSPTVNKVASAKKEDAFSSLFSTAKTTRTASGSKPPTISSTPTSTSVNTTSNNSNNNNSNNNGNNNNNGEIDLLSF